MRKFLGVVGVLSIALVLVLGVSYAQKGTPNPEPPGKDKDFPGAKVFSAATPNLSFPVIMTDVIPTFFMQYPVYDEEDDKYRWEVYYDPDTGLPIPLSVTQSIADTYNGTYPGNEGHTYDYYTLTDGCATDINSWDEDGNIVEGVPDGVIDDADLTSLDMETEFLQVVAPWYDQPVYMSDENVINTYPIPPDEDPLTPDEATYEGPAYDDPNLIWNVDYIDTNTSIGTDPYPSSATGGANAWQADWKYMGELGTITVDDYNVTTELLPVVQEGIIQVDFVDWGNPLENINPVVGQRFPVEVALYEKVGEWDGTALDNSMTIFKMACLEYPGTKVELFGNAPYNYDGTGGSAITFESAFATVLTNKFYAEVWNPNGTITKIPVEPGIGPSGKMNFASAGGGWTPTMAGWHRIWLHVSDPLISLTWAKINNDEHYITSSGCEAQEINPNKLELTGIIGNSTYIDVLVALPNGKPTKRPKKW